MSSVTNLIKYMNKHNGRLEDGTKKPRCCWTYIHGDKCSHSAHLEHGQIICGLWHPGEEERKYLIIRNK